MSGAATDVRSDSKTFLNRVATNFNTSHFRQWIVLGIVLQSSLPDPNNKFHFGLAPNINRMGTPRFLAMDLVDPISAFTAMDCLGLLTGHWAGEPMKLPILSQ
jgi:hypothetical protein